MNKKPDSLIKIGGSLLNRKKFSVFLRGLLPYLKKHRTVIVHGGGHEIGELSSRLGLKTRFVGGRRFTDRETMKAVDMALRGSVNPALVRLLKSLGIKAIGMDGRDAGAVRASRLKSLGWVGLPENVNPDFICWLISRGFTPVVASIAEDGGGNPLNVNADEMAGALASGLPVRRLILFTDVQGILDKDGRTVLRITPEDARDLIRRKIVTGGMIPKISSAMEALKKGVKEIWILEGKLPLHRAKGTLLAKKGHAPSPPFLKGTHYISPFLKERARGISHKGDFSAL